MLYRNHMEKKRREEAKKQRPLTSEDIELEKCTFHPSLLRLKASTARGRTFKQSTDPVPKAYLKTIERIRGAKTKRDEEKKRRDEWRSPYLQKRRVAAESDRDQSGRIVAVPFQLSTSERSKRRGGKTFRELGTEDREQHQRKLINESLNQSWGGTGAAALHLHLCWSCRRIEMCPRRKRMARKMPSDVHRYQYPLRRN